MSTYKNYLFLLCATVIVCCVSSCEDDEPTPFMPCEWQVAEQLLILDTCFDRTTTSLGSYVIPPTIGKEIYEVAFGPTSDDVIYLTVWPRAGLGGHRIASFIDWIYVRMCLLT